MLRLSCKEVSLPYWRMRGGVEKNPTSPRQQLAPTVRHVNEAILDLQTHQTLKLNAPAYVRPHKASQGIAWPIHKIMRNNKSLLF